MSLSNGLPFDPETERDLYLFDTINQDSVKEITEKIQAIERYDISKQEECIDMFEEVVNNYVDLQAEISYLSPKYRPQNINLYIDSCGGDAVSCLGLCSLIESCETPITTIATGEVASAAFVIFVAGHTRLAYKNTTFLYHSVRGWSHGTYAERINSLDYMKNLQEKIDEIVLRGSTLTQKELDKYTKETNMDWVFFGEDALKYSITDELLDYKEDFSTECDDCKVEKCEDCECDR